MIIACSYKSSIHMNRQIIEDGQNTEDPRPSSFTFRFASPSTINLPVIKEPYSYLHGGTFSGALNEESPDPLVGYHWPESRASEGLQIYWLFPVSTSAHPADSFEGLSSISALKPEILVKARGSLEFDFGVESAAWLEFDSPDLNGEVEMSISEYQEVPRLPAPVKTKKPKKYGCTYRLELNPELYEGVRFGWIHIHSLEKPWHITAVRLVCQAKPVNYLGSFSCSDYLLTQIWYVGAYTVRLNLLKDYFGAILMDRGDRQSWTGDSYPAQAAALVAFGNWDFIKQNLEQTASQNNGIESYSLYWILSLVDYYRYTGDADTLRKYLENVQKKLAHGDAIFFDPCHLRFYGWDERLGAGFENPDNPESKNAYRWLFIRACREFAWAAGIVGRTDLQDYYKQKAYQRERELKKQKCCFEALGIHAMAEAINAGGTTRKEMKAMYEKEFSDRLSRLSLSPFNEYFIIQAMAVMGCYNDALGVILDCWAGQINYGGTTFFEVYRPSWNQVIGKNGLVPNSQAGFTSLCHPWSSGITKWLTEEVVGIKPSSPGFASVDIIPHLGHRLKWVSGKVPTPRGIISAKFDVIKGTAEINIPASVVARIGVPKAGKKIKLITLNGKKIWEKGHYHFCQEVGKVNEDLEYVYLNQVQSGRYRMKIVYAGKDLPFMNDQSYKYSAFFLGEDDITSGNWGGKYGLDGYVLFNYDDLGKHREKLPEYIASIKCVGGTNERLLVEDSDRRVLAPDDLNSGYRVFGFFRCAVDRPTWMTESLDILLKKPLRYRLALYALDFDGQGRRQAYEIIDLVTQKLLAPIQVADSFGHGKYHLYEVDRSIRIRLVHLRGHNAGLSGIFFDPALKKK